MDAATATFHHFSLQRCFVVDKLLSVYVCCQDHPAVMPELDIVEEEEQFTHNMRLEDAVNSEDMLSESYYHLTHLL